MSDKKNQKTGQFGFGNKSKTTINQSIAKGQIVLTEEIYKQILENTVKATESGIKDAHNDEKVQLYKQIDGLQNKLANLPESLKKEQKKNAKLVARLKQMGGKVAEKKFKKAIDAFKKNEFAKADKILIEIEETERLDKQDFGEIAYARGDIAEQDVRWHDAFKHYTRASQLDPCFKNLVCAQGLAIDLRSYDSVLSFGKDAKKAAIKEYGEDSKEYATILNNIGVAYNGLKDYESAERLHTEALEIRENIFGKKHPDVGMSLHNLGGVYQEQDQHTKATHFFKKSLNISKKSLGLKHHGTATTLNNLGGAYTALGEFKKAKPLLKQALKINKEILGDNHPNTAGSLYQLGVLYGEQGQYKKAELFNRQAVEIIENAFGPDHHDTKLFKKNHELIKKILANTKKPPSIKFMA